MVLPRNSIFKGYNSIRFSDQNYTKFNVYVNDMGQGQATLTVEDDTVKQLDAAVTIVNSPNLYAKATLTVEILKTMPKYDIYQEAATRNALIDGYLTCTDDSARTHKMMELSLNHPKSIKGDGTEAVCIFEIKGIVLLNQDLMIGLGL